MNFIIVILIITAVQTTDIETILEQEEYIKEEQRLLAASYTDQQLATIAELSIIRGNYEDVCNERNGAVIINASSLNFFGLQDNASPFRDLINLIDATQGYVSIPTTKKMIIQLIQSFELNTVVFRIYDVTGSPSVNLSVDVITRSGVTTNIFTNTAAAIGVHRVSFPSSLVKQIVFTNNDSVAIKIIKVQAFYEF